MLLTLNICLYQCKKQLLFKVSTRVGHLGLISRGEKICYCFVQFVFFWSFSSYENPCFSLSLHYNILSSSPSLGLLIPCCSLMSLCRVPFCLSFSSRWNLSIIFSKSNNQNVLVYKVYFLFSPVALNSHPVLQLHLLVSNRCSYDCWLLVQFYLIEVIFS